MTPIIICLCALGAIVLWSIYASLNTIKSAVVATCQLIVTAIISALALAAFYGLMSLIMALVTDPSLLGEFLKNLLITVVGLVAMAVGAYFLGSILLYLLSFVWGIIEWILGVLLTIFDWLEEKSHDGFRALLTVIANRVDKS